MHILYPLDSKFREQKRGVMVPPLFALTIPSTHFVSLSQFLPLQRSFTFSSKCPCSLPLSLSPHLSLYHSPSPVINLLCDSETIIPSPCP